MIEAFGKSHAAQEHLGSLQESRSIGGDKRWREDVLEDAQLRQQAVILEDESHLAIAELGEVLGCERERIPAFEFHGSRRWRFESADDIEERTLATAGWSYDGNGVAGVEGEGDALEDIQCACRRHVVFF